MKYLIITISFIISVKINAMNLLDYKADSNRVTLEDWKFFSDQVMGGASEGKTSIEKDEGNFFLRLEGRVSTKNNGGFIQVRKEYDLKNVYAKTGTLRHNHNLSGYLVSSEENIYVFSIMVNHHTSSKNEVRNAISQLLYKFQKRLK